VYAVGHADISYRGRWMAAVLAHGDGAVPSHRSAAALWEVLVALGAIAIAHPRHHGSHRLRATLATHLAGTTLTRSDLESRFLGLCRADGLPTPQVNVRLGENTVDFLFPDLRLIVEIDSWKYHRTRARFDADRRRDATHLAVGYRTLRFTDRQRGDEPNAVAQTTRSALHRHDAA